jgi:hypothetical protein
MPCSLLMFLLTKPFALPPSTLRSMGTSVTTRDHSTLTAYCAKTSPSARLITAATAVGSKTDVFNHLGISLKYLILSNFILFTNYCLLHLFLSF